MRPETVAPVDLLALARALEDGSDSPQECVDRALERMELVDDTVAAFLEEPDRRSRLGAAVVALEHSRESARGALHGVPVGVKDLFRADRLPTRAGSRLPAEVFAGDQAESVNRLVEAGAVVLGKTVTTEFAYFEPGPTANPWNPSHTPGGSSSGSAAAVAAGIVPLALGTQTIGSVCRPAAFCGIVGFKPTIARVPTDGVIPFSPTVDHVGTFTANVASARLAARVLCDGWNHQSEKFFETRRPRIAVVADAYSAQAEDYARKAVDRVAGQLESDGYDVQRIELFPDIEELNALHNDLIASEFAHVHADWYAEYSRLYSQKSRELLESGREVDSTRVQTARDRIVEVRSRVEREMDRFGVELLLSPSTVGEAPEGLHATGSPIMNLPWTFTGLPAVSVPAGVGPRGLPLGVQITARSGADEALLGAAEGVERVIGAFFEDR
ncbi:MAG: amidase [Spirochaetales bacterium]